MLELLIELLVEVLFEGLLEVLSTGVREWIIAERGESGEGRSYHPVTAALGYLVLGACLGALSVWLLPHRLLAPPPVPGLSLLVNPVAAGVAMEFWGRHRAARGYRTTNLATWLGGAALALGVSLVRFLGVS
jgi:hypothetical protein